MSVLKELFALLCLTLFTLFSYPLTKVIFDRISYIQLKFGPQNYHLKTILNYLLWSLLESFEKKGFVWKSCGRVELS